MNESLVKLLLYFLLSGLLMSSCEDNDKFSFIPNIRLESMSKNTLNQNFLADADSIIFKIHFEDGDGDFGITNTDTSKVIFEDSRRNFTYPFRIPNINASGTRGIEGTLTVRSGTLCCIFPDGDIPCNVRPDYPIDTIIYTIYIVDLAGNQSNKIKSDPIYIRCDI